MITRIWHGRTTTENAQRYLDFLLEEGTTEYRQTDGNISAKVWRKTNQDACDFWTVTEWQNIESIKAFAGTDYQKAKYYPFDANMLLGFEEHVQHYETHNVSNARIRNHIIQLQRVFHGGNWVAESFEGKLKDLDEEQVFSQPVPGIHSVAELVWHCIYWRRVALHRLQGDQNNYRDRTIEKFNFLPLSELKAKGWEAIRQELQETQKDLIGFLNDKS